MRGKTVILAAVVVTGTIGCDPLFATQYRQTLRPAPTLDCVAATLTELPVVAAMNKLGVHDIGGEGPGYRVTLRDSGGIEWPALVTRQPRPDSAVRVVVTYFYMGFDSPNAAQRKQMASCPNSLGRRARGVRPEVPWRS